MRATLVEALGRRGARAETKILRERAEDKKEALVVRKKATEALGMVCDVESLDFLTELVALGEKPTSVGQRDLALAAISALAKIHPSDLAERLAPVMGPKVPTDLRQKAREAESAKRTCPVAPG